jgi:cell division septation protein DedD
VAVDKILYIFYNILSTKGYKTYIVKVGLFYKVQTGAFNDKNLANNLRDKLIKDGFKDAFVTYY